MSSEEKISPDEFDQELEALMSGKKEPKKKKGGKKLEYIFNDDALTKRLEELGDKEGISLQCYKGLGEMDPEQLWATTMEPSSRTLLQVSIEDAAEAERVVSELMGDQVEPRKEFIQKHALDVRFLDI